MAFSRETTAGVSDDMILPAVVCEPADGGVAGFVGLQQGLVAGIGQGLTAAEAASG
jgi:hypothetical protein